jgi:tRNA A-37 threonylcarbamoyl transferase component Bud32
MTFATGQNVGPYRIIAQLGQGGMATVYKAYHAALDRYVAIKVLHRAFTEDPNFLARFQREARVVAKLEHPNIVPVYDFAEHDGQPYLVMKFIEGETLKARLGRGTLTRVEALRIVEAVGRGLAYAHQRQVLHRDIKPSNVLLAPDGGIYLADFGLARMAQSGESTLSSDVMMGTPHYISPEQARGERDLDARTDIYSFGVLLYELVVGRVPFNADTPFSIIHDHIYTPLPLPRSLNPRVPEAVERTLLKSLAKDRDHRFQTIAEMVTAFRQAVLGQPPAGVPDIPTATEPATTRPRHGEEETLAMPASARDTAARQTRRRSWAWVAGGLGIACLCLGAFAVAANRSGAAGVAPAGEPMPGGDVEALQVAIEAEPDNPDLRLQLARLYRDQGDLAASASEFQKAGDLFLEDRAYTSAANAYAEVLDLEGGPIRAGTDPLLSIVQALTLGAEDPAIWPLAERLAMTYPQSEWILASTARSAIFSGDLGNAREQLDESLRIRPEDPLANSILAEWLFANGELRAARQQVDAARAFGRAPEWIRLYLETVARRINTR